MKSAVSSLWRMVVTGAIAGVLLLLVINAITAPVATETRAYTAEFSDAAGLHVGGDVRVRGIRVGKVDAVELVRHDRQSVASVAFTLDKRYGVTETTRLAIKYQALTGLRYIDVTNPSQDDRNSKVVTHIPTTMTQPSFDITALFNGLEPVLATLSPDDINRFTENVAALLSGDGNGLAPLLDSIRKLTRFASDRQRVTTALVHNLAEVAHGMGGHSKDVIRILDLVGRAAEDVQSLYDELRQADLYGPAFTWSVVRLEEAFGITPTNSLDEGIGRAFTNFDDLTDAFKMVPVMWENIPPPSPAGTPVPCSRGPARLPGDVDILLNGQRVMICNP